MGAFLGTVGSHDAHRHYAHQLSIGLDAPVDVESACTTLHARAVFVPAGITHRMRGRRVLSVYVDALWSAGMPAKFPRGGSPAALDDEVADRLVSTALQQGLAGLVPLLHGVASHEASDPRLATVLSALETGPQSTVRVRDELARMVHLSPDRFSHWFVERTGLPLRSYLKWARLVQALKSLGQGGTLTQSAHAAGFADAAHFSRTFRALLGVSPRELLQQVGLKSD